MTVTATTNRNEYTGDGAQTVFPYTFKIYAGGDLEVYVDGVLKTLTSDYTLSGIANPLGGDVTFVTAPANTKSVLLLRVMSAVQETSYPSNDKFPAKVHEDVVDKLTMLVQQLQEVDLRTIKLAVTSLFSNVVLKDPQVGKYLRWLDSSTIDSAAIVTSGSLGVPVQFADGGTGGSYASRAALADGLSVALYGDGTASIPVASVSGNVIQIPNPLTSNAYKVGTSCNGMTTAGMSAGTILSIYWTASITLTHGAQFYLLGATNASVAADWISTFFYSGGGWIELSRYPIAATSQQGQFKRGDGTWQNSPAVGIKGLTLSNNAGDATNDIDIAAGFTFSDDADPFAREPMYLSSGITKRLDANWTVGTNQGGLDTGAVGNGTYHVFVIKRTDTGVVDVLFSLSATSPTMPSSYTKKQRIGSIIRAAGSIVAFHQLEDYFEIDSPSTLDIDDTSTGTSAKTGTLVNAPTGISVMARLNVAADTFNTAAYLSALDTADLATSNTAAPLGMVASLSGSTALGASGIVRTNTSAQFRYRCSISCRLRIVGLGWIDPRRGRN